MPKTNGKFDVAWTYVNYHQDGRKVVFSDLDPVCTPCPDGTGSEALSTSIDQCIPLGCNAGQAFDSNDVCQDCGVDMGCRGVRRRGVVKWSKWSPWLDTNDGVRPVPVA